MTDLPAPLTPADCNLRGLRFMALDVVRLMDSDLFALSTGDEFKAAVALWCKSWSQVPAASLPDDDRILAHLSGSKRWRSVKAMAMRGWILCSDGRWYHPVVAEEAIAAMDRREDWQEANGNKQTRQQRWRERCKALAEQLRDLGVTPPRGASLETLETMLVDARASTKPSTRRDGVDDVEIGKTGTGKEKRKENISPQTPPAGSEHPDPGEDLPRVDPPAAPEELPGPSPTATGAMAGALRKAGVTVASHNPVLHGWVNDGFTVVQALEAVEICRQHKPVPEPIAAGYLDKVLRGQANGKPGQRTNGAPEPAPWEGAK